MEEDYWVRFLCDGLGWKGIAVVDLAGGGLGVCFRYWYWSHFGAW